MGPFKVVKNGEGLWTWLWTLLCKPNGSGDIEGPIGVQDKALVISSIFHISYVTFLKIYNNNVHKFTFPDNRGSYTCTVYVQ